MVKRKERHAAKKERHTAEKERPAVERHTVERHTAEKENLAKERPENKIMIINIIYYYNLSKSSYLDRYCFIVNSG